MGSLCSSAVPKYDKKVVIVGASFAGLAIAEGLWDSFEVTIIDKNDFFENVCAVPRTLAKD